MAEQAESPLSVTNRPTVRLVSACEDLFGERRSLGLSVVDFKVAGSSSERLLILENTFVEHGGPARHLHHVEDEFLYVLEGEFLVEIGEDFVHLHPGDSLLAPREVPHAWAFVRGHFGRILMVFSPAGQMEAFFREMTRVGSLAPQDPVLWRAYGMELLGPPLPVGSPS